MPRFQVLKWALEACKDITLFVCFFSLSPRIRLVQPACNAACSTEVNVSFSFGGAKSWPINPTDFKLQAQDSSGRISCIGAFFDLNAGSSSTPGSSPPRKRQSNQSTTPSFIVGDTFLVGIISLRMRKDTSFFTTEKRVFCVSIRSAIGRICPTQPIIAGSRISARHRDFRRVSRDIHFNLKSTSTASAAVTFTTGTYTLANPSPSSVNSSSPASSDAPKQAVPLVLLVFGFAATASALGIV